MTWPQVVIAAWLLLMGVLAIYREGANREQSSGMAMFGVCLILALQTGIALVLHAGGFW